ncbi:MAG: hypothetical protein RL514_4121 [Verrucomicrobiota bacterium]|jgi:hypothetical protein
MRYTSMTQQAKSRLSVSHLATAFVLAATAAVYGQDKPAAASEYAAKPAASSGLFNEWLRKETAAAKNWDLGGDVRVRYEGFENAGPSSTAGVSNDFIQGRNTDNDVLYHRLKLHAGYKVSDWFSAYVEGRISGSTGDEVATNSGEDSADIYQAYVTLGDKKAFPVTAKVGRQVLSYGDERFIGQSNWSNVDRSFDAIKLRYQTESFWLDAFISRVVLADDNALNVSDDYDLFSGLYFHSESLVPNQETEFFLLHRNSATGSPTATTGGPTAGSATSARDIATLGMRLKSLPGKLKGWDYSMEAVAQFGSVNVGGALGRIDHEAYAANLGGGYTFKDAFGSPRLGLQYTYSSGDDNPTDGVSRTLDNLYATNHKFYGLMDIVGLRNLHNPTLSLSATPAKGLKVGADYHLFWLADDRDFFYPQSGAGRSTAGTGYGRKTQFSKFLGSEINLTASYAFKPWLTVEGGYGHFFTGGYIRDSLASAGNKAQDADWVYLQTVFKF